MSTKIIDQKAYLQKYLSGPSADKKKKKKKVVRGSGFSIIDDDLDLSKMRALDDDELEVLDGGDDAPQIAGIIDERPEELKILEQFKTGSKWRIVNQDDGFSSKLQVEEVQMDVKKKKKENELIFGKLYSDSEDEDTKNGSDLSPPRIQHTDYGKPDKKHSTKRQQRDSDFSPPRNNDTENRKLKSNKREEYPQRKSRKDMSSQKRSSQADESPSENRKLPPKNRSKNRTHNSTTTRISVDSDVSPPRKRHLSPMREKSNRNDNKIREKHQKRIYNHDSDVSPPRKNKRKTNDSDSDLSPIRKTDKKVESNRKSKRKGNDDSDASPPRKNKRKTNDSDSDLSPMRKSDKKVDSNRKTKKTNSSDSDLSPPRRNDPEKNRRDAPKEKRSKPSRWDTERHSDSPPPTNKKMARTLEGKLAGLQDATQLRQENESFRRREDDAFRSMADEVSGRNAQAVSRKGKRETSEDRQKQREKADRQKELDEKYKRWGRGLKQLEEREARAQHFAHEAAKPLARLAGDCDLEAARRRVEHEGDPMLQYLRDRKRELRPEMPKYKGNFPPNRFAIPPGYRWDGVDRSNGYEKKYFDELSNRRAREEEAFKWSTADL